jgi:hypothetical protein
MPCWKEERIFLVLCHLLTPEPLLDKLHNLVQIPVGIVFSASQFLTLLIPCCWAAFV